MAAIQRGRRRNRLLASIGRCSCQLLLFRGSVDRGSSRGGARKRGCERGATGCCRGVTAGPRRSSLQGAMTTTFLSAALAGAFLLCASPAQTLLRDLTPPPGSPASGSPGPAVQFGSLAVFAATDEYGREPWITDGTPQGTRRLCDCDPGSGSSSPSDFTA